MTDLYFLHYFTTGFTSLIAPMSNERSEPVGSPVKVVKVCFAYVVKPFTGEVVKVCSLKLILKY